MKKFALIIPMFLTVFLFSLEGIAQESNVDVITKLNGEVMKGKVTRMGTDNVTFVYDGEDLEYDVAKSDIHKIVFASGRTQVINELAAPAAPAAPVAPAAPSAAERKGKIAVVPFDFSTNDPSLQNEGLETRAQMECARSLRENTSNLLVQDPRQTNALLAQHNLDAAQLAALAPADVAVLLGVEYVMYGTINVNNKGSHTYGSEVTTYKDKEEKKYETNKNKKENKGSEITTGNSSTTIEYDVKLGLSMYNDQGSSVFSDSREPFGTGVETYTAAMDYMIKRTPFGSKHK